MDMEKAAELLTNTIKGFHGRFKKMYGQISIRVDGKYYLSTGGNKLLADITPDAYELCDITAGDLAEIFRRKPDVNAIIFGCSSDTVKASASGKDIPVSLEDLARLTGSQLRVIPDSSTASILKGLKDSDVCLIKGVGAIAACSNARKAVAGIQIVEKACEAEVHGTMLDGTIPLNRSLAEAYRKNFLNDYIKRNEEPHRTYLGFNEEELSKRAMLVDYGKDLVRHDLSYGSWGNLSVRLGDNEMLITPSSMDYFDIAIEDIVKVDIRTLRIDSLRTPSSEYKMHAAAYREFPDCGAFVNTRSNAISVFAACERGFRLGEGELQDLIGDVMVTGYEEPGSDALADNVVATLRNTHACIIPHHGGVFYGPSLDVVFAIAEAVELKARNLLNFDALPADDDEEAE